MVEFGLNVYALESVTQWFKENGYTQGWEIVIIPRHQLTSDKESMYRLRIEDDIAAMHFKLSMPPSTYIEHLNDLLESLHAVLQKSKGQRA